PIQMERFTFLEYRIRYGAADSDTDKREKHKERELVELTCNGGSMRKAVTAAV
ncbi:hypothetical protein A2U01_0111549, partial [Trifolium medium]|nr:hypothetical protein [Trifolium medium]